MPTVNRPYPPINTQNRAFLDGLSEGELRLQQCDDCGFVRFPPAANCPQCLSTECTWEAMAGRGTVWSFIVMHKSYFKAFADETPYNVVLVELEEGPRMISNLVDPPETGDLCDIPVEAVFGEDSEGRAILQFRARADEGAQQ